MKIERHALQAVQPTTAPWLRISPNRDPGVQYTEVVDDEFSCSLCWEVMVEAACLIRCGHSFCNPCLKRALSRKPECPTCRQPGQESVPNFTLRKLISSLMVKCLFPTCDIAVPHNDLEVHLQKCPNAPFKCNLASTADPRDLCACVCTTEEARAAHRESCDYIAVSCPHGCGEHFSAKLLRPHEEGCAMMVVPCGTCRLMLPRGQLEIHECPNEEVECELCHRTMMRSALPSHMEEAATEHVGQLMGTLTAQTKLMKELKGMLHDQQAQLEDQALKFSTLNGRLPALQASMSSGGSLRITWHAQMQKSYSVYESPIFQCQGYAFSARLSKPPTEGMSTTLGSRPRLGSVGGNSLTSNSGDMYGLFLKSLNDIGVIVQWSVTCGAFRGKYSHFFKEKNAEAGTEGVISGLDGQRLVLEMALRVTNAILEGGDRKNMTMEKYHEKRRRRTLLEPGTEDSVTRDRPPMARTIVAPGTPQAAH